MTEKNMEEKLMELIGDKFEGVDSVKPFDRIHFAMDRGLLIDMEDGSYFNLIIRGYTSSGRRME